ncbi:putative cysteine-rich receptor-like protein kinase 35 [Eucalyptus grandis]|uniref:putative cysteine-rich receptor-like protein kinase 35 n=1 Tax=Eucalyptus grandis TaxID=71139 RepID=UPI00192EA519|nr:putative cysteine-rich receptor-like protein kinase 35 [Eucalyptus grandis]
MGTLKRKFARGSSVLPNLQTLYALLQCSPDLCRVHCDGCLGECINDYQNCCHGRLGRTVEKPSCLFQWDLYQFLESDPGNPPPSPPTAAAKTDPPAPPPPDAQLTDGNTSKSLHIDIAAVGLTVLFLMGKLENGRYVGVKRLEGCSNQGQQQFKNEATVMARLHHKNSD